MTGGGTDQHNGVQTNIDSNKLHGASNVFRLFPLNTERLTTLLVAVL